MSRIDYVGSELDLFSNAHNWKNYWSQHLRPYLGQRILDVGAGIGGTARVFANHPCESYLALEPDSLLAQRIVDASGKGGLPKPLEVTTGTTSDLPNESRFDTILYIDVLEHIASDSEELMRARSLLSPGGRIVVLAPAHQALFSPFDAAIGHYRRYDRKSLLAAKPEDLHVERLFYLDSVGLLASLGNRLLLRASSPTAAQIALWDGKMVPVSRWLDPVLGLRLGKTIVAVFGDRSRT